MEENKHGNVFFLLLCPRPPTKRRFGEPLHSVPPPAQVHDWHARNLPHAPAEVSVAGGNDITAVRFRPLTQTVVGVGPFVVAGQSFEPGVLGDTQRDPVSGPELLQLGHHALGHAGNAFRIQAIHHPLHEVDLVFDRMVDEVCVH